MSDTIPVPRSLMRRLWIALAAGVASLVLTTIQGAVRPAYDPWQQAVSALSLGPGGWIQMLNLIGFGVAILTTVPAWRRVLAGGRGKTAYPLLTALVGAGFVAAGILPQDPAPGYDPAGLALTAPTAHGLAHLAIAGVAALSSVVGLFVIAARLKGDPAWRRWPLYSVTAALVLVACVAVYAVWSTRATGFAGTFERGAMVVPMVWTFMFLRRLTRGTPLVVASPMTPDRLLGADRDQRIDARGVS